MSALGGVDVYECPVCGDHDHWCLATEPDRAGHRQPPADGDMSTEDDWCEGIAQVVAVEIKVEHAALVATVVRAARGVRGALECTNALREALAALDNREDSDG